MSRRSLFMIFVILLLIGGGFVYFVLQDGSSKWQVPVIGDTAKPEPTPDNPTLEDLPSPGFDKAKLSLTEATSLWVVVNKNRPLEPLRYAPADLVNIGGQQLRQEAAEALEKLFAGAKDEGLALQALSGYRSYSRQQTVYQNYVNQYGQAQADTFSARPGHSEHQTGWAIDIGGGGCGIEDCFGDTPHGKWVAAHAYEYGYIVRYPENKQDVTGYKYEPWHIRYVGPELATEMHRQGIVTLEEFFEL